MTESLLAKIEELSEKAAKYDNMRERYKSYADKLLEAEKLIKEVIGELDPVAVVRRKEASGINYPEIAAEIYEKMQTGLEVSVDLITRTYPFDEQKAHYIMNYLRKHHKEIESRRERTQLIIYLRREHK
jgi:DNA integrity scanning protein DisA with diadenylate cyclase activity